MSESLEHFIAALRDELQQYGEMLALLDQQQEAVVRREADTVLQTAAAIHQQNGSIRTARQHRDQCRQELAHRLRQPSRTALGELTALLPEEYRPLINALILENNALLFRVQQRVRQNHLLLHRSLELMQRFIQTLVPSSQIPTYDGSGAMSVAPTFARSYYEAVG